MSSFDAKTRYALLAALDLARFASEDAPAKIRDIAARTNTPAKYLVHILLQLKRRALANSTRGARGGYWLMRPPEMISAAEVIGALQDSSRQYADRADGSAYDAAIDRLASEADRTKRAFLADVSLADLLAASMGS
jgi:Rrf2 family protein